MQRIAIATPWVDAGEDIAELARRHAKPHLKPGDTLFVSEKVVVISLGRAIPADELRPGPLARLLSRSVRATPIAGLNVPEKMQLVVRNAGGPRVLLAAAAAAITRPLGVRGAFYRIVGEWCQNIDGMAPPYDHMVIPPLSEGEATAECERIRGVVGAPTAIVDINDRGGTIRALSPGMDRDWILAALSDNPLGQGSRGTPLGLLRPSAKL